EEDRQRLAARGWRWIVVIALLAGLGKLLSVKAVVQPHLFHVVGLGLAVGLMAWWLMAERVQDSGFGVQETPDPSTQHLAPHTDYNGARAVLALLAGFIVAYQMMGGYGVGLMLLAAWPALAFALSAALETVTDNSSLTPHALRLTPLLSF